MKKNLKVIILAVLILCIIGVAGIKISSEKKKAAGENSITNDTESAKDMPMLVDLGATTCIPCKEMVPVLDEVKKAYKGKAIVKIIDVNDSPDEANKYGIRVIPTQIFLDKEGKEFFRHEGFYSKENIVKIFDKMGVK
jgi:thioredoxin 1